MLEWVLNQTNDHQSIKEFAIEIYDKFLPQLDMLALIFKHCQGKLLLFHTLNSAKK
jgi:hypothetical protein